LGLDAASPPDTLPRMSHPARRPSNRPSRRQREARAYRLTLATGGGAVATVAALVLSIAGVVSFGLVVLLAVLTAISGFLLKRSLGG
jgi:hypothetical protein